MEETRPDPADPLSRERALRSDPPREPEDADSWGSGSAVLGRRLFARTPPPSDAAVRPDSYWRIDDPDFMVQLQLLRDLKEFLLSRAVKVAPENRHLLAFNSLNLLKPWGPGLEKGRPATEEEWAELDLRLQAFNAMLSDAERREFRLTRTPRIVNTLAVVFLVSAIVALAVSVFPPSINVLPTGSSTADTQMGWRLAGYLTWLLCLGGIGAIAFIGVNALAIQSDATFDLANRGQVVRRILIGALFGIVLSLPFGFREFIGFCEAMRVGDVVTETQGALLLLPFLLGFSSSLVMLVLNRLVQGAETVFGLSRGKPG